MRIGVIIPALDEEAALPGTLRELAGQPIEQVIVVDNGSTDRTSEVARAFGAEVIREPRRGYGQACLAGIAALAPQIDVVVFVAADGSDDPAALPRLVAPIACDEADLVLGSRVLGHAEPGALTPSQRLGNALATTLLRWIYALRYTDLGPFRAIRRTALDRLAMQDTGFGWTIEMQIKAARGNLRVAEVPVPCRCRRAGQSKISGTVSGTARAGAKILWTVLRYRLRN